jgi:hypothetical protein
MIVHVPNKDKDPGYFLDPTVKFQPFRQVPLSMEGKNALILEDDRIRITTIPEINLPGEHEIKIKHFLTVKDNLQAEGRDTVIINGKPAADFREQINKWEKLGKLETLISWITQGYPGYFDGNLKILNEQVKEKPLIFIFSYKQEFPLDIYLEGAVISPKLELSFLRYPESSDRKTPIYFPIAVKVKSEWHYSFAGKFQLISSHEEASRKKGHLHWKRYFHLNGPRKLVVQQSWSLKPFIAQADSYRQIKPQWDAILHMASFPLQIERINN